ncbi:MAG TPA: hypothetical protein PKE29_12395 [Phycisphaerales bacterium]|nr:hypothetical protein [Phycisphaerales bacterium]
MKRLVFLAGLVVAGLCTSGALAQTIRVTVRGIDNLERQVGSLHASGDPITITTEQLAQAARTPADPWYSYSFVRIYDTNSEHDGIPTADIGPVTIQPNSPLPAQIRLLVAPPFFASDLTGLADFNFSPDDAMPAGARSFRSLNAAGCAGVRCAIAVTRDIGSASASPRDNIVVAQAYRLQAPGQQDGSGNIHADVTATMDSADFRFGVFTGRPAIGHVMAGQSIQGTLLASGAPIDAFDVELFNGIGKVLAGTTALRTGGAVFGITGDVKAERGRIGSILCNGPIGTSARKSQIRAGNGIDEVRVALVDPGTGVVSVAAPYDIYADIAADLEYLPTRGENSDATLRMVQTDGALTGSIRAGNIPNGAGTPAGIVVRGVVDAPITVKYNMGHTSIIGASFTQPIWVGIQGGADIVATDRVNGTIPRVEIGYESTIPDTYFGFVRGMTSIQCAPIPPTLNSPSDPNYTFSRDHFDADDWIIPDSNNPDRCFEAGAADSLVRAKHIGVARVHTMSGFYGGFLKPYIPRIEAETIDSLEIGDLREGIVWSGRLEYSMGVLANDPSNDYSSIGMMTVGIVGPHSDVWFKDCLVARFTGDIYGELHLPALAESERIVVNGRLLNWPNCSDPNDPVYPQPLGSSMFPSPRGGPCAERGAIRIRDPLGLAGQIILNAANAQADPMPTPESFWQGDVIVGWGTPATSITLNRDASQPFRAPIYWATRAMLGGGAVGVAPFRMHEFDCDPVNNFGIEYTQWDAVTVTDSHFLDSGTPIPIPIKITSYGPVVPAIRVGTTRFPWQSAHSSTLGAIVVQGVDEHNHSQVMEVTSLFTVVAPGTNGLDSRTIGLRRAAAASPAPGLYRVLPRHVASGLIAGEPAVEWPVRLDANGDPDGDGSPAYWFRIAPDCDGNHLNDLWEALNTSVPVCQYTGDPCRADFNRDGTFEVQDIFDFLNAWFAGCMVVGVTPPSTYNCPQPADFNGSGALEVQDIFDFLNAWFAGPSVCH